MSLYIEVIKVIRMYTKDMEWRVNNRYDIGFYNIIWSYTSKYVFQKEFKLLLSFINGSNNNQMKFFLTRRMDRLSYKDCKAILREILTTQYRLMV